MDNPPSSDSRLGRGLSSMFSELSGIKAGTSPSGAGYLRIPLAEIKQTRPGRHADEALVASIKKFGMLQPVLVARVDGGYELLAGARRLAAAKSAGLADVPALVIARERAGPLDVFLEENLTRRELTEPERMHLRDRWVKETGRDLEQAEERIPEVQWEITGPRRAKPQGLWMAAAGVLGVVSTVLLLLLFNAKPVDRRPVVIPVAFTESAPEAAPPVIDLTWMQTFIFPGQAREVTGDRLRITFQQPFVDDGALTQRGQLFLNQLAAVMAAAPQTLQLEIHADEPSCSAAAAHLISEGLDPERIARRPRDGSTTHIDVYP